MARRKRNRFMSWLTNDVAIDLGTANTLVYLKVEKLSLMNHP